MTAALRFLELDDVQVVGIGTEIPVVQANISGNLRLRLPEIDDLPEFGKSKGNAPLAIVGGGPSLKYTIEELRHFRMIMAAGSCHDHLVKNGVVPNYTALADPDPEVMLYLVDPQPTCNYLVASQCHPNVFRDLSEYPVTRWHCGGFGDWLETAFRQAGFPEERIADRPIMTGGGTIGLHCITIAMALGYSNLHFFGFDSCLDPNTSSHHAYDFASADHLANSEPMSTILPVRMGDQQNGRLFHVPKYLMAQLWFFERELRTNGDKFTATIHGDGAIAELMRLWRLQKAA